MVASRGKDPSPPARLRTSLLPRRPGESQVQHRARILGGLSQGDLPASLTTGIESADVQDVDLDAALVPASVSALAAIAALAYSVWSDVQRDRLCARLADDPVWPHRRMGLIDRRQHPTIWRPGCRRIGQADRRGA
jgi:hypothetical protein